MQTLDIHKIILDLIETTSMDDKVVYNNFSDNVRDSFDQICHINKFKCNQTPWINRLVIDTKITQQERL